MSAALTRSTYNTWVWLFFFGIFTLLWLIFVGIGLFLVMRGAPTRRRGVAAGALFTAALVCFTLAMAFTASLHALHMAGAVIIALIANVLAGPFVAVLFSKKHAVLFRNPPAASSKPKSDSDVHSGAAATDTDGGDTSDLKELTGVGAASPTAHANNGDGHDELHIPTRHRLTVIRKAIWRCVPYIAGVYGGMLFVIVVSFVALADGCYCSAPNEFNTWLSRKLAAPHPGRCATGETCHLYAIVGSHCSDVAVVGHYGASGSGDVPVGAVLEWWPLTDGSSMTTDDGAAPAGVAVAGDVPAGVATPSSPTSPRGRIVVDHPIAEDYRVVAQVPVLGLECNAGYRFRMRMVFAGDVVKGPRTLRTRTLPGRASASPVRFIGGGDLHGGAIGHNMMRRLWAAHHAAHFVWVGGDIAYANNIRYCYRRWDTTLALLTGFTRPDGTQPLLMAAVGNHEAGGYLTAKADTRDGRASAYTHYTTVFPSPEVLNDFYLFPSDASAPGRLPSTTAADLPEGHFGHSFATTKGLRGDGTVTFYRAVIGNVGWVVLDSDIMFRTEEQVAYLNETLAFWAARRRAGELAKIVVAYHCPGLPTVRKWEDPQATKVRRDFYPLMLRYNVSLVFEHHDHAYKRSHPIRANGRGGLETAAPYEGFIASGDGALGVGGSRLAAHNRWYHAVSSKSNAGFAVEQSPSGHFSVRVYDENVDMLDAFHA
eukprot:CAMPEP_0174846964 /NCGR_PEP_ID=MMETSP1114-20130205/12622_1 /TAXON_ID=312471 /ORGANISM="Neobodo designis, Strain CCAP 1951/1" /LENGTH=709 /DNA_ID=CAMNT_0016081235 /DNA_START=32 /DNA_END=2161 /DNA_ORIENTATION=+